MSEARQFLTDDQDTQPSILKDLLRAVRSWRASCRARPTSPP